MTPADVLALSAMPPTNPSYPRGPYRFLGREYLVITYETDAEAIRAMVPEPLVPDGSNHVHYEWIAMPDSSGFGSDHESGVVIPCLLNGEPVNHTAMMFLNDEPPISAGREIWGFPKRRGEPKLEVRTDTLTGTLHYGGERVAMVKRDVLLAAQPTKKFVTVGELAALAVFLTTDAAASITGTALPVDGGWTAH